MDFKRFTNNAPLRRLGRKALLNKHLNRLVPQDFDCLISLFYGSGSFENNYVGKIKFLFANDLDSNVFNLYTVIENNFNELIEMIEMFPIGDDSWNHFKDYKSNTKINDVKKAWLFLYYSNFGYMGKSGSLKNGLGQPRIQLLKQLKSFYKNIVSNSYTEILWTNKDFNKALKDMSPNSKRPNEISKIFIFADPPYIGATNNYDTPKWKEADTCDLIKACKEKGCNFMICEFKNPVILQIAKDFGLYVTDVIQRENLKSKDKVTEIVMTNYKPDVYKQTSWI